MAPQQAALAAGAVVVGIDPTKEPLAPLHLGGMLARTLGAPLVLATVFPHHHLLDGPEDPAQQELRAAAREDLLALGAGQPGVVVADAVVLAAASAAASLQDLSEGEGTRVVVIGSTTRGPLRRVLPGTVADRLLSGAACPVAVAPHGYETADAAPPSVVGVGYDGSPEGEGALAFARGLAAAAGARLRVITVRERLALGLAATADTEPAEMADRVLERRLRDTHEAALAARSDVLVEGVLTEGRPSEVLEAQSREVDVLVTGSRGFGPMGAVLLGSTTHPLLRTAHCPLVVTPRVQAD